MATGPLPRFTSMIKTPAYSILLNNLKFETKEIFNDGKNLYLYSILFIVEQ